jgi:hydrogenase maturation factor HypF (carbamoyltransferase family)
LDGLGLGEAGELRGGELLKVNASGHERLGALKPLPRGCTDAACRYQLPAQQQSWATVRCGGGVDGCL